MKKKIIIAAAAAALICFGITGVFFIKNRFALKKTEAHSPTKPHATSVDELEDGIPARERMVMGGEAATARTAAPGAAYKNEDKKGYFAENK